LFKSLGGCGDSHTDELASTLGKSRGGLERGGVDENKLVVREIPERGEGDGSSDVVELEEQPRSDSNSGAREDYGTEREYDDGGEMRT
jgi:hypothetical protein